MTDKTAALQLCVTAIEQVKDALGDADDREVLEYAATLAKAALAFDSPPRAAARRPLVGVDLLEQYGIADPDPRPSVPPVPADVMAWPEAKERAPTEFNDAKPGMSQKELTAAHTTARRQRRG